jgi:pimeloyl-ACP methyl ester carboxylesterase
MKKLIAILSISIILVIVLIVLAFFYIDLTGHKNFSYDVFAAGKMIGSVDVDSYTTEDKAVYKTSAGFKHSLGYPEGTAKLTLRRRNMLLLKYVEELKGVKGIAQTTTIEQKNDKTDFLFFSQPRYFFLKDFETGHKTMVFSPYSLMLYMPIVEKYNFWKKGAQFFEVMIPLEEAVPFMRDKIEVRYLGEEYIPVMGRRMEAERFVVRSEVLPEVKLFLSKYKHQILALEIPKRKVRFVLTRIGSSKIPAAQEEGPPAQEKRLATPSDVDPTREKGKKEIFFKSGNQIISGHLQTPDKEGPFFAVILVPGDGPMTKLEEALLESYAAFMVKAGFAVLSFDKSGQGKSQGNILGLDDEKSVRNIQDAVSYLDKLPEIEKGKIILIGYKGGGYLAMKAAAGIPEANSCITLGMPFKSAGTAHFDEFARKMIKDALDKRGYGTFDETYTKMVTQKLASHLEEITLSADDFSFFMGLRVPVKAYREYITRRSYEAALSFDRPLLMVFGQKDPDFDSQLTDNLEKALKADKKDLAKVAVVRNLDGCMGKGIEYNSLWDFEINEDVPVLIESWIEEVNRPSPPVVEEKTVEPASPAMEMPVREQ